MSQNPSPTKYIYGESKSTIFWLWRQSYWWKINITIDCDKGFKSRYANKTKSIMDDAVEHSLINGNIDKLFAINACRLFHGLLYPSKLLHYDCKYLKLQYLFGNKSQRKECHKYWPTQPCPTDKQWDVWRQFIRSTYTMDDEQTWRIVLQPQYHSHQDRSLDNVTDMLWKPNTNKTSINTMIFSLPSILQRFVQTWEDSQANLYKLWQQLNQGNIQVGSDGSHDPDSTNGAGGAIIASEEEEDNILGVGAKCQIEEGMSSLTTEQYGVISGILAIVLVCKRFGTPNNKPIVKFWIDNNEALTIAQEYNVTPIQLKEYDVSDYWMKNIMQHVTMAANKYLSLRFHKVKSHQSGEDNELSFEARLNNRADELAVWIKIKSLNHQNC